MESPIRFTRALVLMLLFWSNLERGAQAQCPVDPEIEFISASMGAAIHDIQTQGQMVYAVGSGWFSVFDLGNPDFQNPALVSNTYLGAHSALVVRDSLAFTGSTNNKLLVIDISDPNNPFVLSEVLFHQNVGEICLEGNLIYLRSEGFHVIDISDPAFPFLVGGAPVDGLLPIAVKETIAYAGGRFGLALLDVSNPAQIDSIGTIGIRYFKISVFNDIALMSSGTALDVYDISSPANPSLVGSLPMPKAVDIIFEGDTAFVVRREIVYFVDVSDPSLPVILDSTEAPIWPSSIALKHPTLLAAGGFDGLYLADVSDIHRTPFVHSFGTNDRPGLVELALDKALVSNYDSDKPGVYVLDIQSPETPVVGSFFATPSIVFRMTTVGDTAFLISSRLDIVDISDATNPALLSSFNANGSDIAINGSTVYLLNYPLSIQMLDISNISIPTFITDYTALEYDYETYDKLELLGDKLLVPAIKWMNFDRQILTLDVSDPFNITVAGIFDFDPHWFLDAFETRDSTVFVGWTGDLGGGGIDTYDFSDLSSPLLFDSMTTGGYGVSKFEIAASGHFLTIGWFQDGLALWRPRETEFYSPPVATFPTGADLYGLALEEDVVYLSGPAGFITLKLSSMMVCGDADNSQLVNIADVTFLISRIFSGGAAPSCQDQADANGDNKLNISDITFLISRIFADGPEPTCGTTGA